MDLRMCFEQPFVFITLKRVAQSCANQIKYVFMPSVKSNDLELDYTFKYMFRVGEK
jgi:hypothetical protein